MTSTTGHNGGPAITFVDRAFAGEVVVNIGQIDDATKRAFDREVRAGRLTKWRGHWHPVAGASFGIGPLKTCYGLPEVFAHFAA